MQLSYNHNYLDKFKVNESLNNTNHYDSYYDFYFNYIKSDANILGKKHFITQENSILLFPFINENFIYTNLSTQNDIFYSYLKNNSTISNYNNFYPLNIFLDYKLVLTKPEILNFNSDLYSKTNNLIIFEDKNKHLYLKSALIK